MTATGFYLLLTIFSPTGAVSTQLIPRYFVSQDICNAAGGAAVQSFQSHFNIVDQSQRPAMIVDCVPWEKDAN